MEIGFFHVAKDAFKTFFEFDGVLGLGPSSDEGLKDVNFLYVLMKNDIIANENFHVPPMDFDVQVNRFSGNITFGTTKFQGQPAQESSDYFFKTVELPSIPEESIAKNQVFHFYTYDLRLRDIEILNFFDTEGNEINGTVIIDLGVPFIQLPNNTLNYFNSVFFDANCVAVDGELPGHCSCLGKAGYSGMPDIGFRFRNFMKFDFEPKDYLSTPAINSTTLNPFCNLFISNYWIDNLGTNETTGETISLSQNAGFGSIFMVKYGFYQESLRERNELVIGYVKGSFYDRFVLIVGTLVWYVIVIGLLSFLVVSLSWKKYDRLKREKAERDYYARQAEKNGEDPDLPHLESKNMRATMRKMDFTQRMGDYNAVMESSDVGRNSLANLRQSLAH